MKYIFLLIFTISLLLFSSNTGAQGCSDAGVCSVGSLNILQFNFEKLSSKKSTLSMINEDETPLKVKSKSGGKDTVVLLSGAEKVSREKSIETIFENNTDDENTNKNKLKSFYLKNSFQLTSIYGIGDNSTSVSTIQIEGNFNIVKEKLYTQVKLPYTFINGNLASVNGFGDFTMSINYVALNKNYSNLSLTGGLKVPTNSADIFKDNLPLPMVYQTSLGSKDVLFGAKYTYRKWDITFGYQHSFEATQNQYLHRVTANENYNSYFQSKEMKRADDVIFRGNRNFRIKKSVVSSGLLFIYHLDEDAITDISGNRVKAVGSKGLTLNLNLAGLLPISKTVDLIFLFATPLVTRDYRTDGLTRGVVFITGIKYNLYKNRDSK